MPGPWVAVAEGEGGDVDPDRPGGGPLADDDVQAEVLHRRVEDLLDGAGEAVDLVDEEDVAVLGGRQDRRQVSGPLQHRTGGDAETDPELGGDDVGERRLA